MKKFIVSDLLRISLGLLMVWPFFDKLLGLGFHTCALTNSAGVKTGFEFMCKKAWLVGGSPTGGFLTKASGPLGEWFHPLGNNMAGYAVADWLFMLGLLLIGLCFLFGVGMKIASWSGFLMMALMYAAAFAPETHPFVDDHMIYAFAFLMYGTVMPEQVVGLGNVWGRWSLVEKYPVLK